MDKITTLFLFKFLGIGIDADGVFGRQCVDVIKAFIRFIVGHMVNIHTGNAWEIWSHNTLSQWATKVNFDSSKIKRGDIIVWSRRISPTGHVAIATGRVQHGRLEVAEQDGSHPDSAVFNKRWRSFNSISGILRIKPALVKAFLERQAKPVRINGSSINYGPKPKAKQSPAKHIADSAQRGIKFGAILASVHTFLNADEFNIDSFKGVIEQIGLHGWDVVLLVALGTLLIVGYKVALIRVKQGSTRPLWRGIVKVFGSVRGAEAEADPIVRQLFKL